MLVKKILKLIKGLLIIIKRPVLLNLVIESSEEMNKKVVSKYGLKYGLPTVDLLELFPDFNETIQPYSCMDGTSSIVDLALLKKLALRYKAENYFEIGTWRGESVANVSKVVKNCYSLNLSDEEMYALKLDKTYIESHRFFSGNLPNVKHLFGHSDKFDFSPYNGKIDLVFVDGDHHYESVKKDTVKAFKLLKNENSIIVWHDYSSDTLKVRWDVLLGIMDGSPENARDKIYHISNTLTAVYLPDKVKADYLPFIQKPNKVFGIELKAVKG
jgi:hypothetical protein